MNNHDFLSDIRESLRDFKWPAFIISYFLGFAMCILIFKSSGPGLILTASGIVFVVGLSHLILTPQLVAMAKEYAEAFRMFWANLNHSRPEEYDLWFFGFFGQKAVKWQVRILSLVIMGISCYGFYKGIYL